LIKEDMQYKFGEKLRTVRERRGYTLKDVAKRANVSESLVSQIERNKVSPSVDTLLLIADVLDIDYEYLFSDYRQKRRASIVRVSERGSIRRNKVIIHQLSSAEEVSDCPAIEAFLLEIEKTGEQGDREYGHVGREFGIILEGQAELIYGDETYILNKGDSISFPSNIPHLLKNTGEQVLTAIWVVTPPRKLFRS
jgi:transcriptional regulator with XRE-family HTH domain